MVQWDSIKIYQYYSGCYAILIGLNTHVFCYFLEVICSLEEARQLLPELTKKTHDAVASFCRDHVSCALLHLTELNQPSLQTCIAMLPTPKVSCVYVRGIAMLPTPKVSCVYARVINHFHTCFKFCWKMWMDSLTTLLVDLPCVDGHLVLRDMRMPLNYLLLNFLGYYNGLFFSL